MDFLSKPFNVALFFSRQTRSKVCENGGHSPSANHVAESWKGDRDNREARRRLRIVRKLQELEEDENQIAALQVSTNSTNEKLPSL